jgi:hypothetical protein
MESAFSQGSIMGGANDEHFVDGYAKTESNDYFILPIGQFTPQFK